MKHYDPIQAALALQLAGALADAETAYRQILSTDAFNVEARHYLGVLLHKTGDTQQALELIHSAFKIDARSAERYNDLGNILTEINDLKNAAAAFRSALDLNPEDANVWNNLGFVLQRLQDLPGAEAAYLAAFRIADDFVPALMNLAALLAETGRETESTLFSCQAYIQPPLADKSPRILGYAYYQLGRLTDAAACYRAWLNAEPDNAYARHHLAACTAENVPDQAAEGYLQLLFDDMAEHFEQKLVVKLGYCGPEIIARLLAACVTAQANLDVLDGGCGTGLCASLLKPYARRLTGVDISPGMLSKAAEKNCYDDLVEMELHAYLSGQTKAWDLIVMADTLIYFGTLGGLFAAVRQALRPGGLFAFTVEAALENPGSFQLSPSGRYCHHQLYITKLLNEQGFILLRSEDATLRMELGKPVSGFGILAQVS